MTHEEFGNYLRILRSIDSHELGDPPWWPAFRDDPYLFFMRSDNDRAAFIWRAMLLRSLPAGRP